MKKILFAAFICSTMLVFTSCREKTAKEKLQDQMEEMKETMEDAIDDGADEMKKALDNAGDELEKMKDKLQK